MITEPARVLFDGACAFCQKSVAMLRKLDWRHRLDYVDFRREDDPRLTGVDVPRERLAEEMHVVTPYGALYHGFAALRWLAWRLPLLWPIAPLLYIPGVPWLGQKLYLWIARNRFDLVPCKHGACELKRPDPVCTHVRDSASR
jgi:predicted DCC family thiol-disulfide oxidoreductase YuxK